jgi:hypothetical protein
VPAEKDPVLLRKVKTRLRRRLGQLTGSVTFRTEEDVERLAMVALRSGRMVSREPRYRRYEWFRQRWEKMVEVFITAHPNGDEKDDDSYYRDLSDWMSHCSTSASRECCFRAGSGGAGPATTATGWESASWRRRSVARSAVATNLRRCREIGSSRPTLS